MDYKQLFTTNRGILGSITMTVAFIRKQDYDSGIRGFKNILVYLQTAASILITEDEKLRKDGITVDNQYLMQLLSDIMKAQEEKDYILLADLLELTLLPFFVLLQDMIRQVRGETLYDDYFGINIEALAGQNLVLADMIKKTYINLKRKAGTREYTASNGVVYSVEDTQFGNPTLKVMRNGKSYYLHSNSDPVSEGERLADTCHSGDAERINVCGAGLLYHAFSIANKSLLAYPVHIYEPDCNVLAIALTTWNITENLQNNYIYLHLDESMQEFTKAISNQSWGFLIHYPSLRNIGNVEVKNSMEKFFIAENTVRNQSRLLTINFKGNIKKLQNNTNQVTVIDEILPGLAGKEIYIIAAGPSLDKNIGLLRGRSPDSLLLATGTVFIKMIKMGIRPDFVIITDPNERVVSQIWQQEQETIPMLILSTANRKFADTYAGTKYLIFQKGFPEAEKIAEQLNCTVFETGGSVSTTALDVAIRGKAAKIIFLGLDLAFTDNLAHAEGTSNRIAADGDELIRVKAFDGGYVLTDYKFTIYREWMERRIQGIGESGIAIINATQGGAYIQGMRHMQLDEAMKK